ncbi:hypothetical protein [Vreelandella populi]|uniref:DUF4136 domain-containing protein n=1 Tax=Vreelandella populi TaxID=2498858 RepID=A0A433L8P1_9GAMM|nr:hypothetical protein [Halomonas populi]RUR36989.1 hypothetical protein ELY25_12055 [Halomonas populi]RUR44040.1 hypothetical protein ELY37_15595 [Halomonas populi]
MKPISVTLTCLLALAGCQATPDRLPQAEPAPSATCYFPSSSANTQAVLRQSVAVLTEWGFELDSTDTSLGLVSASREKALHGYYDPYDNAYGYGRGMRMFGGFGIGRGSGIGIGLGFGGGLNHQPIEVERVSLLVGDRDVRISRDLRRYDHSGDLRESYSASNDDFCRRFQAVLQQTSTPAGNAP